MSASPTSAVASTKRPLEDPSSPAGPNDMPDAKRQALDKSVANDANAENDEERPAANGSHEVEATPKQEESAANETVGSPSQSAIKPEDHIKEETQPIPSLAPTNERNMPPSSSIMPTQDESQWIHVRSVISSAEAATVIGKGGENVTQIRRLSGAKCTVSDYSKGAVERILTVSGAQDAVAKVRLLSSS